MPLVFLIGFMGSGKTTFGKKLANKLGLPFLDLDELAIQQNNVGSVKELIELKGIAYFRQAESEALKNLTIKEAVISTGGGTPCYFDNMAWMKQHGVVVFLQVDEGVIYSRLKSTDLEERPLLKGLDEDGLKQFIHQTLTQRLPYYNQAHVVFNPVKQEIGELLYAIQNR